MSPPPPLPTQIKSYYFGAKGAYWITVYTYLSTLFAFNLEASNTHMFLTTPTED